MSANSEPASRKRGRPRLLDGSAESQFRALFSEIRSRRSLQNRAYSSAAASVLKEVPDHLERFRWIFGAQGSTGATWRMGVLVELGRLRDPERIVNLADAMCRAAAKRRLTTTEAMALIRRARARRGGDKERCRPSHDGLVNALCTALDHYRRSHPGTQPRDLLEALNEVYSIVAEMEERDGMGRPQ